jgi:DUF4097 and DUF4098 domain-containing protein YvlB
MMMSVFASLLTLLAVTTQTDTTLKVSPGARLNLNNFGGEIAIQAWGKNALHIAAAHPSRVQVLINQDGPNIDVRSISERGIPARVDYQIAVPAWMALALSGVYGDVSILDSKGEVSAQTVSGDVSLRGGQGYVKLSSVQGTVNADRSRGRLELSSVNGDVRVTDADGDISVEAVSGDVLLQGIRSSRIEAETVSGDVTFLGAIERDGHYRFASHNGDLDVGIPEHADATISVATFSGDFESSFPVQLTTARRGKRFGFTVGKGSALIDLETFGGTIKLRRLIGGKLELEKRETPAPR